MRFRVLLLLKLTAVAAAFAVLFHFVQWSEVLATLASSNLVLVCLGVLVFLAGQVMAAARWRWILLNDRIDISLGRALRMNLIGTFAGNFLPGMATGDLAKSALLFRSFPEKRPFLIASAVCDRIFGVVAIFILMILSTLLIGAMRGNWIFAQYAAVAGAVLAISLWVLASKINFVRMLRLLSNALAERSAVFIGDLQRLLRTRRLAKRALLLSLGFQLSWAITQWIMLCAVSSDAPFVPVLAASTFSLIVALLPISINGLGLREGAFSFALQQFGIHPQIAVAVAMLSLLPILASSMIGGALLGWNRGGPAPLNR